MMKVIFMGTPEFSVMPLRMLIENHEVLAVVTNIDKPKGRGNVVTSSPVKEEAQKHGITVLQPKSLKDGEIYEQLKKINADVIVVIAYGKILPKAVLTLPKYGCINVHASLLPKLRGASPIQHAIITGETKTGVTTMLMDEGLDTGDMLEKMEIAIDETDTSETLHDKLSHLSVCALKQTLEKLESGTIIRTKQDGTQASYAPIIDKAMGKIEFSKDGKSILNLIRGLNPWPSAYTYHNGNMLKLWNAEYVSDATTAEPGRILDIVKQKGFLVKTGDGALLMTEVQLQGKKKMNAGDFLRGYTINIGDALA